MAIEGISLSELDENERGPLWVLNNAANTKRKLRGNVHISIPAVNGKGEDGLTVEHTWLPIDAAEFIPRPRLLQATQFRRAVISGLIKVISRDDAERLLMQDGAYEERERLDGLKDIVANATKQRSIKAEMTVVGGDNDDDAGEAEAVEMFGEENLAKAAKRGIEADEDGLQPAFKMQADRWVEESDMSVLNAMRARGKFTPGELRYMKSILKKDVHTTTLARIEAGLKKK
jgi:hypothetical protein